MSKNERPDDLLTAGQAAQYLAEKWGIESYSTDAFRMLRHRWGLKPAILISENATLWRRSDLDSIPKPSRNNPRPRAKKSKEAEPVTEDVDTEDHAMLHYA